MCSALVKDPANPPSGNHVRKNDKLAVAWRTNAVMTVRAFHSGSKTEVTQMPSRCTKKLSTIKPNVVFDYSKHMGGVKHTDHYTASYQFKRRTKKWYRKMIWLLEVSIVNSYLLYVLVQKQHSKKPITNEKFRQFCGIRST
jgi:hypothetical protein